MDTLAALKSLLRPLTNRVRLMVGRGTLHGVDDGKPVQRVQAEFLAGEVRDAMPRIQDYGLTSHPLAGMETVAVFRGGDRSDGVVIVVGDRQFRLKGLRPGEVALYDDLGQKVHLTRTGILIETALNIIVKAGKTLRLEGETVEIRAGKLLQWEVNGYGEQIRHVEGMTYQRETYQLGAVMLPDPVHPVSPTALPSEIA